MKTLIASLCVASLLAAGSTNASTTSKCGVERWSVKTLTDSAARQINWKPKLATITDLAVLPPSNQLSRSQAEKQTYRVKGTIVGAKIEADRDIHAILVDGPYTMIIEFPDVSCTHGAQHRYAMQVARQHLERFGTFSSSFFKTLNIPVTITGVLFLDRDHGQRGIAPNGAELHPVTGFKS